MTIQLTRPLKIPDRPRILRCQRAPDLGPRLLFFSGGEALRLFSRRLIHYTHNSIHLITPFDSGGSSAVIRSAFQMLAVGDLRNRLMALADQSLRGNPEVFELFAFRFSKTAPQSELRELFESMLHGRHELVRAIPEPMRDLVCDHLRFFHDEMKPDFDLRGANIGNLILAGGFHNHARQIDPVVYLFSKLVEARGTVSPVVDTPYHLAARLADGSTIVGQHLLTGKEVPPLTVPIDEIFLVSDLASTTPVSVPIKPRARRLIDRADLICYPFGSFDPSGSAGLLPDGVGEAIAASAVPKVFIPKCGVDPEQIGMTLGASVRRLIRYLLKDHRGDCPASRLLQYVLIDRAAHQATDDDVREVESLGVRVVEAELATPQSRPLVDPTLAAEALLSFI